MHEVYPDKREEPEHGSGFYQGETVIPQVSTSQYEERRFAALDRAIEALRGHGDADAIVKCSRTFEAYLKGDDNA